MSTEEAVQRQFNTIEIAEFLDVCPRMVLILRKRDGLPYVKLGSRVVFDLAKVEAWMKARTTGGAK